MMKIEISLFNMNKNNYLLKNKNNKKFDYNYLYNIYIIHVYLFIK